MLADAVGEFLDVVGEREFDEPLLALLRARGFTDIHFLHGSYEFGKDVIAKRVEDGQLTQYVIQSKAGDLNLAGWQSIAGQVDLLKNNTIAHPNFDEHLPRHATLVLTGRLIGAGLTASQNYEQRSIERGEPPLDVWDRDRLLGFLTDAPDAVLAGSVTPALLGLIAAIENRKITEAQIEEYTASWIRVGELPTHAAAFEVALIASKLAHTGRKDLAAFAGLAFVRAVWACAQGIDPPPGGAFAQAAYGRQIFVFHAVETWNQVQGIEKDALAALNASGGYYSTFRAVSLRLMEMLGLLALADPDHRQSIAEWLSAFVETNPGACQPMSDRWAVSLIPAAIVLHEVDREQAIALLRAVTKWVCDYYDGDGIGLAPTDADAQEEVDYLLGAAFEHISRPARDSSYLSTVVLDIAAALELPEAYDDARNDFLAVRAFPIVPLPNDDVDQYRVAGAAVPVDTAPKYADEWRRGDGWQMAPHHRIPSEAHYLGRLDRPWDQFAVSAVTRNRHCVSAIRSIAAHFHDL